MIRWIGLAEKFSVSSWPFYLENFMALRLVNEISNYFLLYLSRFIAYIWGLRVGEGVHGKVPAVRQAQDWWDTEGNKIIY